MKNGKIGSWMKKRWLCSRRLRLWNKKLIPLTYRSTLRKMSKKWLIWRTLLKSWKKKSSNLRSNWMKRSKLLKKSMANFTSKTVSTPLVLRKSLLRIVMVHLPGYWTMVMAVRSMTELSLRVRLLKLSQMMRMVLAERLSMKILGRAMAMRNTSLTEQKRLVDLLRVTTMTRNEVLILIQRVCKLRLTEKPLR